MSTDPKPPDTGMMRRLVIAETYGSEARAAWRDAKSRGMKDPVLFIFDCRDQVGGVIARGVVGKETVDGVIARSEENEIDDAIMLICQPFDYCQKMMRMGFRYLDGLVAEYREDVIPWLVFAAGGATPGRWRLADTHMPKSGMN